MDELKIATYRYELVTSTIYESIRQEQLNHIIQLSNSQTDPTLLKGMLKLIYDTDKWKKDFDTLKKRKADIQNGK